jgi:hypothetical protein
VPEVRPLQRDDLPEVATLVHENLPDWEPRQGIPGFLASTLIEDPWTDDELPSLVAHGDDGKMIGFVAAQVRRFRLGERRLRGLCVSHVVVDPKSRPLGALLLRRVLTGPQDFAYSDSASMEIVRIWRAFGAHLDQSRACDWMIVLRPVRWLRSVTATAVSRRRALSRGEVPVGAFPFQAAGPRLVGRAFPELEPGVSGEDVDSATIVELLPDLTRGIELHADYDQGFLDHLFADIETLYGQVVRRIVRRDGDPIGWYAYVPNRGGVTRVLHLATGEPDDGAVLGELVKHARAEGRSVITGRLEPHLQVALRERFAVLGFARQPVIHVPDPELRAALASETSLLTQLDSEWFVT